MRVGVRGESIMIKSGHLARKSPACFALLVTAGLFTLVFSMLSPSFQTNDDTQMMMIASGKGIGLAPDEHIVFSNVVIGQVLKALYGAYPAIPWYGVYLYFVQYLAYSSLLYCVIVPGFTRWRLALYVLYFAGVGIFSLNNLQFTTVACVAGQSGTLACMTALRRRTASAESRVCGLLSVGVGMLVVASLIRLACIVPTILIAIPVAICWFAWPPRRAVLLPAATSAAACAVLVLGFAVYHNSYYNRDSKWQEFLRYNKLRAKFNDYGWIRYTPETASIFNAVCWSENDHAMIERWFYDDPVVYSEARLQRIVAANNWRTRSLMIEYVWRHVEMILRDKSLWPMFFLFPLFLWASALNAQSSDMLRECNRSASAVGRFGGADQTAAQPRLFSRIDISTGGGAGRDS